jgi:hypothetical protein
LTSFGVHIAPPVNAKLFSGSFKFNSRCFVIKSTYTENQKFNLINIE